MSKREEIQQQLSAYLDGELSEREAKDVEQSLGADESLRRELEELRRLRKELGALPKEQAPEDLAENILQQAERTTLIQATESGARRRRMRWIKYVAAAAMVLIVATVAMVVVHELSSLDHMDRARTLAQKTEDSQDSQIASTKTATRDADQDVPGGQIASLDERAEVRPDEPRVSEAQVEPVSQPTLQEQMTIFTDNPGAVKKNIEQVLALNDVTPLLPAGEKQQLASQNAYALKSNNGSLQYKVLASRQQLVQIQKQVQLVQQLQDVSQMALPENVQAAKEGSALALQREKKESEDVGENIAAAPRKNVVSRRDGESFSKARENRDLPAASRTRDAKEVEDSVSVTKPAESTQSSLESGTPEAAPPTQSTTQPVQTQPTQPSSAPAVSQRTQGQLIIEVNYRSRETDRKLREYLQQVETQPTTKSTQTQPATQPDSQPASLPSSAPATAPTSAPTTQPKE